MSWISWENFESGSYFDTKKDSSVPGSKAQFLGVNSTGVYAIEHNHALFSPWQSPLGGQSKVSQVKAPSAPAEKGARRAKRETSPDSFSDSINLPVPSKPQAFTQEYNHWEGLPEVSSTDRSRFSDQLWTAPGSQNPDKYPFSVLCAGSGGVNVYDHQYKFMGVISNDKFSVKAVFPHLATQKLIVASAENGIDIFSFKNLFGPSNANVSNLGYKPASVTVLDRSAPQIVVGGEQVLLFDMESTRRVSDVFLEHAGTQVAAIALTLDHSRPDVFYAMGMNQAFLVDLRLGSKKATRAFAPSST